MDERALFDRAPCGLIEATSDGRIRRVNVRFCEWVGYTAEELCERRLADLLTVGGRIFHHTHWAPLLHMQGSISEVKLELKHRDGTPIPMVLNAVRVTEGSVTIDYVAAFVARDRDRYEQELVRARRKLEAALAELEVLHVHEQARARYAEQLMGIVSHDLRNPLSVIQMGATLLRKSVAVEGRTTVERIERSVHRANALIGDLLDLTQARLGSGIVVTRTAIALHDVIAEALDELRPLHPTRTLEHVRAGDSPCTGDPARLGQVVGNLVSNALAYGDPDLPVTVTSEAEPARCSIRVHNHGAAIPDELQATLFEPMTRGTHAGAKVRSVGLGLFIVREIARSHGGDATVTSTPEDGTTFQVAWPSTAS